MIATLVIAAAMVQPHRHTDILGRPAAYGALLIVGVAELAIAMLSAKIVIPAYIFVYGSGLLTGYHPDAVAAWTEFQTQPWDTIGFGTLALVANIAMGGFLALGKGRRAHLDGGSRARVAGTAIAAATGGWIAGTVLTTAAVAAQQNVAGYEMGVTITACLVSGLVAGHWCVKAARDWSDGTGGGTGRFIKATREKVREIGAATPENHRPADQPAR